MIKNLYEKYGRSRVYLVTAIALVAVSIITLTIIYQTKISFSINGTRFKYAFTSYQQIIFKDNENNEVTVTIDDYGLGYSPSAIGGKYRISYKDEMIKYDGTGWQNNSQIITRADGTQYNYIRPDSDSLPYLEFDTQLVTYINNVYDFVKNGHLFLRLLFSIPLILLGLACMMYPEQVWLLKKVLYVRGGEPTEFALDMNKLGGTVIIVFALLIPFLKL